VNTRRRKDSTAAVPADFFPSLAPKTKPATTADHLIAAEAWAAAGLGTVTVLD
jgi:hypothetical protein